MNTRNQDSIIDSVGAEDWEQVVEEFGGQTLQQIKNQLDEMFPDDDNGNLAQSIDTEINA